MITNMISSINPQKYKTARLVGCTTLTSSTLAPHYSALHFSITDNQLTSTEQIRTIQVIPRASGNLLGATTSELVANFPMHGTYLQECCVIRDVDSTYMATAHGKIFKRESDVMTTIASYPMLLNIDSLELQLIPGTDYSNTPGVFMSAYGNQHIQWGFCYVNFEV